MCLILSAAFLYTFSPSVARAAGSIIYVGRFNDDFLSKPSILFPFIIAYWSDSFVMFQQHQDLFSENKI